MKKDVYFETISKTKAGIRLAKVMHEKIYEKDANEKTEALPSRMSNGSRVGDRDETWVRFILPEIVVFEQLR